MEEKKPDSPLNITYMIKFKKEASLQEVIMVLNSLGLATQDSGLANDFRQYPGIEIKESGIIGKKNGPKP